MSDYSSLISRISDILDIPADMVENVNFRSLNKLDSLAYVHLACAIEEELSIDIEQHEYPLLDTWCNIKELALAKKSLKTKVQIRAKIPKIIVWGTCMSQQVILKMAMNHDVIFIKFFSRTTFASQYSKKFIYFDKLDLDKIELEYIKIHIFEDMMKTVFTEIFEYDFDFLLIDVIDVKSSLFMTDNSLCTLFFEQILESVGFKELYPRGIVVNPLTKYYFSLWKSGWDLFWEIVVKKQCENKIIINEIYMAKKLENGLPVLGMSQEAICSYNQLYKQCYTEISKNVPKEQIVSYDEDDFLAATKYEFGVGPTHYSEHFIELMTVNLQRIIRQMLCGAQ